MLSKVKQRLNMENILLFLVASLSVLATAPFGALFATNISSFLFYILTALILFLISNQLLKGVFQGKPIKSLLFFAPQVFLFAVFLSTIFNPPWLYGTFAYLNNFDSFLVFLLLIFTYKFTTASFKENFYAKLLKLLQSIYLLNFFLVLFAIVGQLSSWWSFAAPILNPLEYSVFSSVVLLLSVLQDAKYKKELILKYATIIAGFISLLFINIYVSWLALLAGSMMSLYFYFKVKFDAKSIALIALFVTSAIFLLFGSTIASFIQGYTGVSVSQNPRPSAVAGILIMQNSYNASLKNKLLGTGPSSFVFDWFNYKSNDAASVGIYWNSVFDKSANSVLHFFTTFGVLGGLAWLALLLGILSYVFRFAFAANYKRLANTTIVNSYVAVFVLALAFFFYTPGLFTLMLFFVFLANFVVSLKEKSLLKSFNPKSKFALKEKLCPWLQRLIALLALYAALSIVMGFAFAYLKNSAKDDTGAFESYAKIASYILPTRAVIYDDLASVAAYRLRQEVVKDSKKEEKGNKVSQAAYADEMVRYLEKAALAEPRNFQRWLSLASAQALKYSVTKDETDYKMATESVIKASRLAPNHPFVYFTLSYVASVKQDFATMKQALLRAISLKPDFRDAYTTLYDVALTQNNTQEAVSIAQLEVQNNPNDFIAWKRLALAFLNNKQYKEAELTVKDILARYPKNAQMDTELLQILLIALNAQDKKTEAVEILKKLSKEYKDSSINKMLEALQADAATADNKKGAEDVKADHEREAQDTQENK